MRRREEVRVLARDGDHAAHVLLAVAAQVLAGEGHAPALRIEEAEEEVRTTVVLPAPLGPRSATRRPGSRRRLKPSSAGRSSGE